jgi:Uncharacterised nucleotidyltransferase
MGCPWESLRQLVEKAPSVTALREHRVHLFAARCWRDEGRTVPEELRADERRAAVMAIAARPLLIKIRAAYDGTLMLMKGPEAAAHHLHPETRYFRDLDLLVDDPIEAQRALLARGFVQGRPEGGYVSAQHLAPLAHPGLPLVIELHRRPNCPSWLTPPPAAAVLDLAVPSMAGVPGIVAPSAAAHALLLAAHSWTDRPVGRLVDLVDVVAVLGDNERAATDRLADEWGWQGLWRTTLALADALLAGDGNPLSLKTWARHFRDARERTVIEEHVARAVGPAWTLPPAQAPQAVTAALARTTSRRPGEDWGDKLRRSRLAFRHAFTEGSAHARALETLTREP